MVELAPTRPSVISQLRLWVLFRRWAFLVALEYFKKNSYISVRHGLNFICMCVI